MQELLTAKAQGRPLARSIKREEGKKKEDEMLLNKAYPSFFPFVPSVVILPPIFVRAVEPTVRCVVRG
jgi:hypothetical protein